MPRSATPWLPERCPRDSAKRGSGSGRNTRPRQSARGAPTAGYGIGSSFGRHCSALRGRTIRVVAFRASHPVKPPSRQQRFVQRFREHPRPSLRISLFYPPLCSHAFHGLGVTNWDDYGPRGGRPHEQAIPYRRLGAVILLVIIPFPAVTR